MRPHCSWIVKEKFFFIHLNSSLFYLTFSSFTSFFSLLSSLSVLRRWVCFGDGRGSWVMIWCASTMCSSDFVSLSLWVWFHGFGFMGLRSWIIDVTGVDHRVDWRGSSTWSVSSAWVIDLISVGLWSLWWSLELWWLVASGGFDCWVETMRPRRREGEIVRLRGRERDSETRERGWKK